MTEYVVDASITLKWFVPEPDTGVAESLLKSGATFHGPRFLAVETANAAWKNWRKNLVDRSVVESVGGRLRRLIDVWHSDDDLYDDAVSMALSLNHPIFDCLYLVLADRLGIRTVTADARMLSVAPRDAVIALADWKP